MRRFGSIILLILISCAVHAQEIKVTSGFVKDSVALGEPVAYYLTARYPESVLALFPDSTYKFTPFEFGKKQYFTTKTANGISFDSAVYTLSTFEIDKTQYLSLPVYVTTARDCTAIESLRDSIFLIEQIKIPPTDTLALKQLTLKSNTLYERVFTDFNRFIVMIVLIVLAIVAIIGWFLYGKKIVRYLKIKKLEKKYQQFAQAFSREVAEIDQNFSREKTEHALSTWKKYLEQLERKPYTKLTTREVIKMDSDQLLGGTLTVIDKVIYGHQTVVTEPLNALKTIAEQRFTKKLEQIRHE